MDYKSNRKMKLYNYPDAKQVLVSYALCPDHLAGAQCFYLTDKPEFGGYCLIN